MNQPQTAAPLAQSTQPEQIWQTLSAAQRAAVRQQLLQLCRQLLAHWAQEHSHDTPRTTTP
jgi:hypothetical protein